MEGEADNQKPVSSLEVEQELRQLNDDWVEAFVKRDTARLGQIMADDFVFVSPLDGDGKQQFLGDIESGDLTAESLTRDNLDVRIYENTAVLSATDTAKWQYHGHEILGHYRIISVYSRRHGKWQLVSVQACPTSR
jgi:ketosteroid isomerase-like protein